MTANNAPPAVIRRVETPGSAVVSRHAATFEDLQTVLRCCERLVSELGGEGAADDVVVEAVWTTALLSYTRCFDGTGGPALTEDDLTTVQPKGEVLEWHTVLVQLRDHYADPGTNPRERFSVGVAQGSDGTAEGIAITSARQPLVDEMTVRQTGAIAYSLSALVNDRIISAQESVLEELKGLSASDLEQMDRLDVASPEGS